MPRSPRLFGLLFEFGDAGDAVYGERADLVTQMVEGAQISTLDTQRLDNALRRAPLRVDVTNPDRGPVARGFLQAGQRARAWRRGHHAARWFGGRDRSPGDGG